MNVADFDFELPDELIAQDPPPERGDSRLLVLNRRTGDIEDAMFADIHRYLSAGDVLVLNNTRVFPARLIGRRDPTGGEVECLLIRQIPNPKTQIPTPNTEEWEALMHPGQKLKPGARVLFEGGGVTIRGEVAGAHFYGRRTVRLWTDTAVDVLTAIERIGHIPLPPYIRREDRPADRDRYQTVYARDHGSVAAPTAGLHFTAGTLAGLRARGVDVQRWQVDRRRETARHRNIEIAILNGDEGQIQHRAQRRHLHRDAPVANDRCRDDGQHVQ